MARRPKNLTGRGVLLWTLALALVLLLSLALGVGLGAGGIAWGELLPGGAPLSEVSSTILFRVRIPRVLLAAVLGGSLTVAGIVFQALLRNPLADPYVLGVSGGASLGGVLALLMGLGSGAGIVSQLGVPTFAFMGAAASLFLIEWIATVGGRLTVPTILLTGVIFNAFSGALIYFIQSLASLEELHAIVFYLMGQVPSLGYESLGVIAVLSVAAVVALLFFARDYNVLTLGEESALQLGVSVERVKRRTFVLGSLLTGLSVSVAGMIGFVGLVVPHWLRLLLGPDHRLLLPAGFLGGAAFLVLADLASRILAAPSEIPVGVITALVGGPFFLYLLRSRKGEYRFG